MLRQACLLLLTVAAAVSGMSAWSAPSFHVRTDPFDGTAAQMTPGWLQVIYERNGYNYTLMDTFELNCVYGDSKKPLAYFSSKVAKLVSKELSDGAYVPVWCKYFDTLEPTKLTKPDNINQFIVTFGLFPRITSESTMYDGYDLTTPFLTSRLAFAVPRTSSVLPARDTLSYSKAKQLIRSNANEYEWTFLQDSQLDKNLKSDLYGMLPKSELLNVYKQARRASFNDFFNKVYRYDPLHKQSSSKVPVMIGELPSLRYYQQYNNYCAKMKIIETFIEANAYSLGVRYPPLVVDKDIYDTFRTAVDQAILKLMRNGELELLTQQILNSESTCLEERRVVTVGAVELPPFVERQQDGSFTGLCIDMLNQVENDTGIQFEYRLIGDQNTPTTQKYKHKKQNYARRNENIQTELYSNDNSGTHNPWENLIGEVYKGRIHMAVGPLTITPERALAVDFSIPFMTSELGAMLPSNYTDVYSLTDILDRNFRVAVARSSNAFTLLTTSDAPALRLLGERIAFRTKSVAEAIDLLSSEPYIIVVDDYVSLKRHTMVGGASMSMMVNKPQSSSQIQRMVNEMVVAPINRAFGDDMSGSEEDSNIDNKNSDIDGSLGSGSSNNMPQMKVVRFGLYSSSSNYAFAFPKVSGRTYANEKFTDRLRDAVSTKIEEMLRNGQIAELTDRYFENL